MAAKIFEVNDVLPATTRLRISWVDSLDNIPTNKAIKSNLGSFSLVGRGYGSDLYIKDTTGAGLGIKIYNTTSGFIYPYTDYEGDHAYCDIDTSTWDIFFRTIFSIDTEIDGYFTWQDLNTLPSGYTITFNTNGGTTIPDIEDATELPTPLPPTTKPGYTFGGWYYDSNFQIRAKAGDTIEANTTLYAKWLTLAQVLEHINNVVEELRSAIINKGGDAEGKLLIDFATIINSLKTYEVVETLAELELLEPTLNRLVYVEEGSGELTMGAPVKVTQDGDTLIIG